MPDLHLKFPLQQKEGAVKTIVSAEMLNEGRQCEVESARLCVSACVRTHDALMEVCGPACVCVCAAAKGRGSVHACACVCVYAGVFVLCVCVSALCGCGMVAWVRVCGCREKGCENKATASLTMRINHVCVGMLNDIRCRCRPTRPLPPIMFWLGPSDTSARLRARMLQR